MRITRGTFVKTITALGFVLLSQLGTAQGTIPDYIKNAVANKERTPEMVERDSARHPAEALAMSGIKPGDNVVEFAGFGQYYTYILSPLVGPKGKVMMYDLPYTEARAGEASRKFVAAHPNTSYTVVDYNNIELPKNVDIVFIMLYYHDMSINKIDTAVLNKKIFDALKPGGVLMIEDHNAEAGSGRRDTNKIHRIDPAVIKREVTAAGFKLVEDSNILASATDDKSKMVFAPGTRGATDRSLFKFVKPAK